MDKPITDGFKFQEGVCYAYVRLEDTQNFITGQILIHDKPKKEIGWALCYRATDRWHYVKERTPIIGFVMEIVPLFPYHAPPTPVNIDLKDFITAFTEQWTQKK